MHSIVARRIGVARFGAAGSKGSQVGSMYMDASTRMLAQQVCGWLGVGSR